MKLVKSFYYAFCGLGYCIRHERNFRIHITALVTVLAFSYIYGLQGSEYPVIILTAAVVMAMEAMNTAVERAVDTATDAMTENAKRAKDASAAAVLISAIGAVVTAVFVFSDKDKLLSVIKLFTGPAYFAGLIVYIAVFLYFIFGFKERNKK